MESMNGYKHALKCIAKGHAELLCCVYQTIMRNKILTALIISCVANCALVVALAQERAQNDLNEQEIMQLQIENDSLGGKQTNISYRYM